MEAQQYMCLFTLGGKNMTHGSPLKISHTYICSLFFFGASENKIYLQLTVPQKEKKKKKKKIEKKEVSNFQTSVRGENRVGQQIFPLLRLGIGSVRIADSCRKFLQQVGSKDKYEHVQVHRLTFERSKVMTSRIKVCCCCRGTCKCCL